MSAIPAALCCCFIESVLGLARAGSRPRQAWALLAAVLLLPMLVGCGRVERAGSGATLAPAAAAAVQATTAVPTSAQAVSWFNGCMAKGVEADARGTLGQYMVTTNVWNPSAATAFSQCVRGRHDNTSGKVDLQLNWSISGSNNQVLSFPNIAYGWQVGTDQGSTTRRLPAPVSAIGDLQASGRIETTCAPGATCTMNTAFDLLFSQTTTPNVWPPTGELMVWLQASCKHCNAGKLVDKVTIDGVVFELYKGEVTPPTGTASWIYVAYVAESTVTQFDFNFRNFLADAQQRGYLKPSDILAVLELGTEITAGQGSTTLSGYSVR